VVNGCPQPNLVFLEAYKGFQFVEFPDLWSRFRVVSIRESSAIPNNKLSDFTCGLGQYLEIAFWVIVLLIFILIWRILQADSALY